MDWPSGPNTPGFISVRRGATKSANPIPLFALKRSVVVPRRVDPRKHLLDWVKPQFMQDLSQIVKGG